MTLPDLVCPFPDPVPLLPFTDPAFPLPDRSFDGDFWIDTDEKCPRIVVAAGDSGHGFKFGAAAVIVMIIVVVVSSIALSIISFLLHHNPDSLQHLT